MTNKTFTPSAIASISEWDVADTSFRPHKLTHMNAQKYLSLQPLPVIVEEAEAVEFVLWRGVVGMNAPAAHFMSGFRPRRWSLIHTNTHTENSIFVTTVLAFLMSALKGLSNGVAEL